MNDAVNGSISSDLSNSLSLPTRTTKKVTHGGCSESGGGVDSGRWTVSGGKETPAVERGMEIGRTEEHAAAICRSMLIG